MARDLRVTTNALHSSVLALAAAPAASKQRAAQRAFRDALLAWKCATAFRSGPFASSGAFQGAAFWPARAAAIEAVLTFEEPVDERRIEALAADARGLFALERLLFDSALAGDLTSVHGAAAARARAYARELSANVRGYSERIARLLGDGHAYAIAFAQNGQASIELLVAQSIDTLELVRGKLTRVTRAAARHEPRAAAVEGYYSGTSLAIACALVAGTKQLYIGGSGGGLADLVAVTSRPIDRHVRALFDDAEADLRALQTPLELAVDERPAAFATATRSMQSLSHILKVEMASALEVL
jgi:predicted lipoprotein